MPLPTVSTNDPPRPPEATPDPMNRAPEPPLDVDPDEKTSVPLVPANPALADRMVMPPLEDAVPSPEAIASKPPVVRVLRPADAKRRPP